MTVADVFPARPVAVADDRAARSAVRDPRLDFARGFSLIVILFSHTPGTMMAQWMPVRWAFSDAAEIFVFCSGMASALAFGAVFVRAGWLMGTARVAFRIWQLYWAHIAVFFAIAASMAALDLSMWFDKDYIGSLNLHPFFENPAPQLLGLFTLSYVPNYFDILPLYMALLALLPVMMALARLSPALALGVSVTLWIMAQGAFMETVGLGRWHLELPAEPWSNRSWFFNPFAWQLVFFTGFGLIRGWIPVPPVTRTLIAVAAIILLAGIAMNFGARQFGWEWAGDWRSANRAWISKTDQGPVRFVQFLALAYLGWVAAGPGGARLRPEGGGALARGWRGFVTVLTKVGQQSLAVFMFSMVLGRLLGVLIDIGNDAPSVAYAVDIAGAGSMILVAYLVAWFKSQPWRARKAVP